MASLKVMGPGGHAVLEYEPTDALLVEEAETKFDLMIRQGYTPFVTGVDAPAEVIREFDPSLHIVMVPRIAGGAR